MMRWKRFSVLKKAEAIQREIIFPFCQWGTRRVWKA